ncbi:uncharacterized protein E0L32_002981 [Thyridium curvatum]|uniref:Alpha/beta hydrolase fold-3 domain-containing protein n=1 Tax=Thyridium curvatum TaxID=1093900 RepID=A0A507BMD0_9PEZI|nr:uncharacterized protein E0L32_002981 [Thyridium curvatum]TPX17880.1 hypothetical protein E0L32_002981 [Thyridium curvatum]
MPLRYDPEWRSQAGPTLLDQGEVLPVGDVATRRSRYDALFVQYVSEVPEDLELQVYKAPAPDGYEVEIFHLSHKETKAKLGAGDKTPAVLHVHGGGFISVRARNILGSIAPFVRESKVPFFSVDYRWAPENPFPTPVEDCWTALQYLHSNAEALGVDKSRIAVMGESAGGGLAAGLAVMARDRRLSPSLAKQILIYPMLDDRTVLDHSDGLAIFSINDVYTGWQAYLGDDYGTDRVSPVAAPARITTAEGLPELYLDVGQLDIFLGEDLAYATKFLSAGIQTEFHVYQGVIHAFQRWSPGSRIVKQAFRNRLGAICTL